MLTHIRYLVLGVLLIGWTHALPAQSRLQQWDASGVRAIYTIDAPAFRWHMKAVDATAYPLFIGAVPASWMVAFYTGNRQDLHLATALLVAEGASFVAVTGIKHLVRRKRPYRALEGITPRSTSADVESPYSFPSGHATAAFTIATVLSLRYRKWYVVAPAATWALSVGISRIWTGMHYPTDVMAGACLGVLIGVLSVKVTSWLLP